MRRRGAAGRPGRPPARQGRGPTEHRLPRPIPVRMRRAPVLGMCPLGATGVHRRPRPPPERRAGRPEDRPAVAGGAGRSGPTGAGGEGRAWRRGLCPVMEQRPACGDGGGGRSGEAGQVGGGGQGASGRSLGAARGGRVDRVRGSRCPGPSLVVAGRGRCRGGGAFADRRRLSTRATGGIGPVGFRCGGEGWPSRGGCVLVEPGSGAVPRLGSGQVAAMGAVAAPVRRTRSAGASSICSPRRPADTYTVGWSAADASTTVGSRRRCPSGLIPPRT